MNSPIVKAARSPRPPRVSLRLLAGLAVLAGVGAMLLGPGWTRGRALDVFLYTTGGALMTALGCVPLAWMPSRADADVRTRIQGQATALTAGAMAFASFDLLEEGIRCSASWPPVEALLGAVVGAVFVALADRLIHHLDVRLEDCDIANHRQAILIFVVMTLHSFAEGMGIGVSFSDSADQTLGPFIAISIGLHNIAEGALIALPLMARGDADLVRTAALAVTSSLPQPIVALPFFALVQDHHGLLPIGLGAAAGAMTYLVVTEIAPDAVRHIGRGRAVPWVAASAALMAGVRQLISMTSATTSGLVSVI